LRIGERLSPDGSGIPFQRGNRGIAAAQINGVAGDDGLGTDSDKGNEKGGVEGELGW
jgi:hypothetical protein